MASSYITNACRKVQVSSLHLHLGLKWLIFNFSRPLLFTFLVPTSNAWKKVLFRWWFCLISNLTKFLFSHLHKKKFTGFRPSGVHIPANGKGVVPPAILDKDGKPIYDRAFNDPYNPYNRFNGLYNNGYHGNFNRFNRPYDSRYPYNPAAYNPYNNFNNPYRPNWLNNNNQIVNNQAKKEEPEKKA